MENLGPLQYKLIEGSDINHFHLYKDGVQLPNVFRIGGLGGQFKDGYCVLIYYSDFKLLSSKLKKGYSSDIGRSCIINTDGEIVLESKHLIEYIYHIGGIIASCNNREIYNLKTKEVIMKDHLGISYTSQYLFISTYNNEVYKIDKYTGDIEIFE
jgi:hypothetical protein